METQLPEDFKDLLKLLNLHEVKYLLIGGYAVSYHGYIRTTDDIDFFIGISEENAEKINNVLIDFGFQGGVDKNLFLTKENIVRLGAPPLRVELLTSISGISFEECWENRVLDKIEGVSVPIISLRDLIKNKSSTGRTKDLADIEHLEM